MSDILSQSEIDRLISELAAGDGAKCLAADEEDSLSVKPYDFRLANRFPKEQIRTINIVMQNFVQLLASYFTTALHSTSEIELLSIEELTFYEFNNALPSPLVLAVVSSPPLEGSILFHLSPEIADCVVSRLFGGHGTNNSQAKKAFTEIELAIIERVIRQMLVFFDEAWAKVIKFRSRLERIETSSQFAQIVDINEPVAVITLNVTMGTVSGVISICLPHMAIEPVAKQLNARLWYSGTKGKKVVPAAEDIEDKIYGTPVEIHAFFNDTSASAKDIACLQVGDVIQLEHKLNEPLTVKVQNIPKFHAFIGTKGLKYAVRVTDVIKGVEEDE